MIELRFDELAQMIGGKLANDSHAAGRFRGVSIDSRTIRAGELFVALKGERFDGHAFAADAVKRGAGGVLATRSVIGPDITVADFPLVMVDDSHRAMIHLAALYLSGLNCRRVGITGTNGKTTTKELACQLARSAEPTAWRSPGNYNNLFGIPLSIFSIPQDCALAFFELGISKPGEMKELASLVQPEVILITNIGRSHLEFLGSVELVADEKLNLVRQAKNETVVIYNGDDRLLRQKILKLRPDAISFGLTKESNIFPDEVIPEEDGTHRVVISGQTFRLPLFGYHQVHNFLAAYAIFVSLGYDVSTLDSQSIEFKTAPMRGEISNRDGVTIISDCYNANPDSLLSGLESFAKLTTKRRKVVIVGDMLELGREEQQYHEEIGHSLSSFRFELNILVGPCCKAMADSAISAGLDSDTVRHYATADLAGSDIGDLIGDGDIVYVKGSRGIGLEQIVQRFGNREKKS